MCSVVLRCHWGQGLSINQSIKRATSQSINQSNYTWYSFPSRHLQRCSWPKQLFRRKHQLSDGYETKVKSYYCCCCYYYYCYYRYYYHYYNYYTCYYCYYYNTAASTLLQNIIDGKFQNVVEERILITNLADEWIDQHRQLAYPLYTGRYHLVYQSHRTLSYQWQPFYKQ